MYRAQAADILKDICLLTNGGTDGPVLANSSAIAQMNGAQSFILEEFISRLVSAAAALEVDHLLECLTKVKALHASPLALCTARLA